MTGYLTVRCLFQQQQISLTVYTCGMKLGKCKWEEGKKYLNLKSFLFSLPHLIKCWFFIDIVSKKKFTLKNSTSRKKVTRIQTKYLFISYFSNQKENDIFFIAMDYKIFRLEGERMKINRIKRNCFINASKKVREENVCFFILFMWYNLCTSILSTYVWKQSKLIKFNVFKKKSYWKNI